MNATDNVQVTEVRITISDADGNTLEQGMALAVDNTCWESATVTQGRIKVEAFDHARNPACSEL